MYDIFIFFFFLGRWEKYSPEIFVPGRNVKISNTFFTPDYRILFHETITVFIRMSENSYVNSLLWDCAVKFNAEHGENAWLKHMNTSTFGQVTELKYKSPIIVAINAMCVCLLDVYINAFYSFVNSHDYTSSLFYIFILSAFHIREYFVLRRAAFRSR